MARHGFHARFVNSTDPAEVARAIAETLTTAESAAAIRHANDLYIARHEDQPVQLERMWELILETCGRKADGSLLY